MSILHTYKPEDQCAEVAERNLLDFTKKSFPSDWKVLIEAKNNNNNLRYSWQIEDLNKKMPIEACAMTGGAELLTGVHKAMERINMRRTRAKQRSIKWNISKALYPWRIVQVPKERREPVRGRSDSELRAYRHGPSKIVQDKIDHITFTMNSNVEQLRKRFARSGNRVAKSDKFAIKWHKEKAYTGSRTAFTGFELHVKLSATFRMLVDRDFPLIGDQCFGMPTIALSEDKVIVGKFESIELNEVGELNGVKLKRVAWIELGNDEVQYGWLAMKRYSDRYVAYALNHDMEKAMQLMRLRVRRKMMAD